MITIPIAITQSDITIYTNSKKTVILSANIVKRFCKIPKIVSESVKTPLMISALFVSTK
jgi:hypothetical protein